MVRGSNSLVLYFILHLSKLVLPTNTEVKNLSVVGQVIKTVFDIDVRNHTQIMSIFQVGDDYKCQLDSLKNKTRFKRQGKFADAATMGQTKVMRLILQLAKNSMVKNSVGPVHPLHPAVAQVFADLVKTKIINYFSPDVTVPPKVNN